MCSPGYGAKFFDRIKTGNHKDCPYELYGGGGFGTSERLQGPMFFGKMANQLKKNEYREINETKTG